jgi:dienelactone hydrolase
MRPASLLLFVWLAAGIQPALARQELIEVSGRADASGPVRVPYLIDVPEGTGPAAALVVLPQGNGRLDLDRKALPIRHGARTLLFMRAADAFRSAGFAIALVDAPSDRPRGIDARFRAEPEHRADIAAVVRDVRRRLPGARVFLAGPDVGAVSALHAAADPGITTEGVVLIGGAFNELRTFDYAAVRTPVLALHHVDDGCGMSPLIEGLQAAARARMQFVPMHGGRAPESANPCLSATPHGLWGLDHDAIRRIADWTDGGDGRASGAPAVPRLALNEEVLFVAGSGEAGDVRLETTLYRPDGPGPFPLAIVNHGVPPDKTEVERRRIRYRYLSQARALVDRGFAVAIPMRRGYGYSSGGFNPASCDIAGYGRVDAQDIRAVADHLKGHPSIDAARVLLVGQSAGALAALAYASQGDPAVIGVVNFAGGLRLMGNSQSELCWRPALVRAFSDYGSRIRRPSLWVYAENDSYFPPELVDEGVTAFRSAGADAWLERLAPFKRDGHFVFGDPDGNALWLPLLDRFLAGLDATAASGSDSAEY